MPVPSFVTPERPEVTWSLSTNGPLGDALMLSFGWGKTNEWSTWYVVHVAEYQGTVQLPALPDELASFRPEIGDLIGETGLRHVDLLSVDGATAFFEGNAEGDVELNTAVLKAVASRYP